MNSKIEHWLSLPKSFYVCLKLLGFRQAVKLPLLVRYNVKIQSLKGCVILPEKTERYMVQIGFQYVGIHDVTYRRTMLEIDGTLEFQGKAKIGSGSQLCVIKGGHLSFGDGMMNTCSGQIVCLKRIRIGKDFLMGWDTLLMDTDFHFLENVNTHEVNAAQRDVLIGNNVWMAARSMILKGSIIPDGCTIGAGTIVTGQFDKQNCVIAGNPAHVVKEGYRRKE